ncbi:MAG TPA: OmpA family protein [Bryobacteraceae bacterium]|nr:OmpA family protein [Bryobacteraceae bacterium]
MRVFASVLVALLPIAAIGQEPNPSQNNQQAQTGGSTPIFKVQVVSRSIQAVSYRNRSGWTKVNFRGTALAPKAKGSAEVRSQLGHMEIKLDVKDLPVADSFGTEFMTYVLWAITPDGHPANLGEVVTDSHGNFSGNVTTELQSFGLIITAEPYFAVRQPSDVVVMENVVPNDIKAKVETVDANYQLLQRGQYTYHVPESQQHPVRVDHSGKKSPLEVDEAMNAVQIARYAKADQYAKDAFNDATKLLDQAQDYQRRKQWNPATMTAKEAVQKAEDARTISLREQQQLAQQQERAAAAARVARAREQAAEAARQQQAAEQQTQVEQQQRQAAERARAEADAARAEASAQAQKARDAAAEADRLRQQAVQNEAALRQQLLQQFNSVLETRETPRGLVVNMNDVLFDTGKYSLREAAKEKLAKISGIVLSHPGLHLQLEGYTDSTGSEEFNQKLSEQRANAVRDFLASQGVSPDSMSVVGYGESNPIASNDNATGRQLNRRVEMVVSGEVIGVKIGVPPNAQGAKGSGPVIPPSAPMPPTSPDTQSPQTPPAPPQQ